MKFQLNEHRIRALYIMVQVIIIDSSTLISKLGEKIPSIIDDIITTVEASRRLI